MTDSPSYNLTFEDRSDYLYALVRAESINQEMAFAYVREVAAKCAELRKKRLMIERDIPVMLPMGDLFFTTAQFVSILKSIRVAFLSPHLQNQKDFDFAITTAVNRGGQFGNFVTVEAAEKWLLR